MRIEFFDPDKSSNDDKASFTLNWTKALGWRENPFALKTLLIAGMEEERQQINLFFIKERKLGLLTGKSGTGKSTLLKWLKTQLDEYNNLDAHKISARRMQGEEDLRITIAQPYRGPFSKNKPLSTHELTELLDKKVKGKYVLLVDDAEALDKHSLEVISAILTLNASIMMTSEKKIKGLPSDDELDLKLKERSLEDYERILVQRIEEVGGEGIKPFTTDQVKTLAKAASSTKEFLDTAQEVAIELALKRVTQDSDQSLDELEEQASTSKSKGKKRYDELIESLTEDSES